MQRCVIDVQRFLKGKSGDIAVFSALVLPAFILIFFFLVSKGETYNIREELKSYIEISAKAAANTAVVLEDTQGQRICVILNDRGANRNDTWLHTTQTLSQNINVAGSSLLNPEEVFIESIGTEESPNAWGWNPTTHDFTRPSSMRDLNEYFKKGEVSIVIRGRFKPNYLPLGDLWDGYKIEVHTLVSCLS